MAKNILAPKVIADPLYGIVDIRPVLPMVETEAFQALGDKRQLGMAYLTFPSATHTRKAHSLGAYHATRELADRWIKFGFIKKREGDALAGYALYHDIGHPAFSHVTEPFCPAPLLPEKSGAGRALSKNTALSLAVIREHKKEIRACGIDFSLLEALASHAHPLHAAVSDKNLGTEKLDYLERDGMVTVLSRPPGISYLREHIYFINGKLATDEKVVDNAIEAQNFYLKMYKNVYLRKASVIAQRMLQKMTYHLILAKELAPADLPRLTDSELLGIMRISKDRVVRDLYALLKRRDLFREAIVVRPKKFSDIEPQAEKYIAVFGAEEKEMDRLMKNPSFDVANQAALEAREKEIAAIAGIPEDAVLITPVATPERFDAQDILIYRGGKKELASLREQYPAHFENLEEIAQTYLAFRICATEKYRKALSAPRVAEKIFYATVLDIRSGQGYIPEYRETKH